MTRNGKISGGHLDDDAPRSRRQRVKEDARYFAQLSGGEPEDHMAEAEHLEPEEPKPYFDDDLTTSGLMPTKFYKYTDPAGKLLYRVGALRARLGSRRQAVQAAATKHRRRLGLRRGPRQGAVPLAGPDRPT